MTSRNKKSQKRTMKKSLGSRKAPSTMPTTNNRHASKNNNKNQSSPPANARLPRPIHQTIQTTRTRNIGRLQTIQPLLPPHSSILPRTTSITRQRSPNKTFRQPPTMTAQTSVPEATTPLKKQNRCQRQRCQHYQRQKLSPPSPAPQLEITKPPTISNQSRKFCLKTFGFIANHHHLLHKNIQNALCHMPAEAFFHKINKLTFHNLCTELLPPPGLCIFLSLGAKFCIQQGQLPSNCQSSIQ